MAEIVLYEEEPRPYAPAPKLQWAPQMMQQRRGTKILRDIDRILEVLEHVCDPLQKHMRYLKVRP